MEPSFVHSSHPVERRQTTIRVLTDSVKKKRWPSARLNKWENSIPYTVYNTYSHRYRYICDRPHSQRLLRGTCLMKKDATAAQIPMEKLNHIVAWIASSYAPDTMAFVRGSSSLR